MGSLEEFKIPYLGLTNGSHEFRFDLRDEFFSHFEKSTVRQGEFSVDLDFEKRDRMVVLTIAAKGSFKADCDRCLSLIDVPMEFQDQIILKLTEEVRPQEDEVYYLDSNTSHIDVSGYLYETIHLHLPIKNLRDCQGDDYKFCDQDVINNLEDRNKTSEASGENPWSELDKLNLK